MNIGIDIEEISRFADKPFVENRSFYERIFTPAEIEYCNSRPFPAQHFAVRFCAKEAAMKALRNAVDPLKIEVVKKNDIPVISIDGMQASISLSHAKDYACAVVLLDENTE